ncbi:MAG: Permease component of ABC-type sugar transporter [Lachnoclostridium sp.]|jgi:raffinose/stachyose/melibiose transport system permease protein
MKVKRRDWVNMGIFILPGLALFVLFFIIPVGYVLVTSFYEWNGITKPIFTGVSNYNNIFGDRVFWRSVKNNIIWALVAGCIQVPLALLMALILSRKPIGWQFFRTVYFLPQVISGIALAMLWSAVYNSEYGLLNGLLRTIGLGKYAKNWLGSLDTAFPCMLIYWVFYIGYYMVIMMADITNVDESYYEAAKIDGAGTISQHIYVTIPLIRGSISTCVTLAMIFGLRTFEQVYLLTNGGPANRTSVLVLYLYNQMKTNDYGGANASSVMLILTGACVILLIRKFFSRFDRD